MKNLLKYLLFIVLMLILSTESFSQYNMKTNSVDSLISNDIILRNIKIRHHKDQMISSFGFSIVMSTGIAIDARGTLDIPSYRRFIAPYVGFDLIMLGRGFYHLGKYKKLKKQNKGLIFN